ncbi:MAG: hypothetical protein Q9M76_02605 [Candidatus Dojkabacteria bacterium]|nr:hypothetical protein [Candidatus Dojkabacteria bacterium]
MNQSVIIVTKKKHSVETVAEKLNVLNFDKNNSIEIQLDVDKNKLGIEKSRSIIEWNYKKNDKIRFCLIHNADRLTREAQNAILKVIEEPSITSKIVLIVNNERILSNTILSRCIVVYERNDSNIKTNQFEELLDLNFIDRGKKFDEFLKSDSKRSEIDEVINSALSYIIKNIIIISNKNDINNVIEFFKSAKIANSRNVSLKLIAKNINYYLDYLK